MLTKCRIGVARQAAGRASSPAHGKTDPLDLPHGDPEESAATEISVCPVDAHDDREIDQGPVRGQVKRGFGRPVAGAVGIDLPQPVIIYNDNQGAVALSKNPGSHARNKHIDIKYHYIRQHVEDGSVRVEYISTDAMMADVLTKPLSKVKHLQHTQSLGLMTVLA